ncbi:MAG TPA: CapA family protein [Gemmatimonadaceae bacterium]|nr:CapA family protein [Gemmatimonadaceae bacterium]
MNHKRALAFVVALIVACAPPRVPEPTTPRVPPTPSRTEAGAARRDSARVVPRDDRGDSSRSPARAVARRATRPNARTDTLAVRTLRAPVRVCAGGDVTLGTNLDPGWARPAAAKLRARFQRDDAPASLIAPLRPLVADAELVLVNVESAIGAGPTPTKCGPRSTNCFAFRAPISSAPALRSLAPKGTVIGNIANNHARDAGSEGRDSTIVALTRAGVVITGADSAATVVPTRGGDSIAVLGFYTSDSTPDARDTAAVRRLVARAADRYPAVIVTMHLGAEGQKAQRTLDAPERYLGIDRGNPVAFAEAAVRGGATLVIGHGPHVLRAVEWRDRGALIAYSLGNLLTYGPFRLREPMNRGAVLCTTIDTSGRARDAELRPTMQLVPGVMEMDSSGRALALVDSLGQLDFPGTAARVGKQGALRSKRR